MKYSPHLYAKAYTVALICLITLGLVIFTLMNPTNLLIVVSEIEVEIFDAIL